MSLCKYDKVSLTTFNSGIASCQAQKSSISISLTIDVARYFCLPLEILSPPHSTLGSWIYEMHQRTLQLMEFIQWQNIWRRVRCRYLFTWQYFLWDYYLCPSTEGFVSRQSQNSFVCSWKLYFLAHPFWSGGGSSFSAHTFKTVSLQIKSPWVILPSVSRWEPDCITAILHSWRNLY